MKQRGAWGAQSGERPTSAQITISRSMGLSPTSGCVLTARSLEPASDSVSPFLSLPLPCSCSVSVSVKNNKHLKQILNTFKKLKKKRRSRDGRWGGTSLANGASRIASQRPAAAGGWEDCSGASEGTRLARSWVSDSSLQNQERRGSCCSSPAPVPGHGGPGTSPSSQVLLRAEWGPVRAAGHDPMGGLQPYRYLGVLGPCPGGNAPTVRVLPVPSLGGRRALSLIRCLCCFVTHGRALWSGWGIPTPTG